MAILACFTSMAWAQVPDSMLQFELSNQLKSSANRWNRGDLDGFLSDYLDSTEMTFTSAGRVYKGFTALQDRYRESYGDSLETMGQLSFSDLEVWRLGPEQALTLGRWSLKRSAEGQDRVDEGVFTLVLVKVDGKWRILHDHTSALRK